MTDKDLFEKVFGETAETHMIWYLGTIRIIGKEAADKLLFFALWDECIKEDWWREFKGCTYIMPIWEMIDDSLINPITFIKRLKEYLG